ncbi:MAG: hypothetical protein GX221_06200 [Candidatus Riflebacteria bacterium]|nr:hypothetical protein [Candidatus Riflebacteria bacterium]
MKTTICSRNILKKIALPLMLCLFLALSMLFKCNAKPQGTLREVILNDGTRLVGYIDSMSGGVYTIKTESMGTITIEERKIRQISDYMPQAIQQPLEHRPSAYNNNRSNSYSPPNQSRKSSQSAPPANYESEYNQAQQKLQQNMSNPGFLDSLMNLSSDPDMLDAMSDPEFMRAINEFDIEYLMNDPTMQKIMQSDGIQNILGY